MACLIEPAANFPVPESQSHFNTPYNMLYKIQVGVLQASPTTFAGFAMHTSKQRKWNRNIHSLKMLHDQRRSRTQVNIWESFDRCRRLRAERYYGTDANLAHVFLNLMYFKHCYWGMKRCTSKALGFCFQHNKLSFSYEKETIAVIQSTASRSFS